MLKVGPYRALWQSRKEEEERLGTQWTCQLWKLYCSRSSLLYQSFFFPPKRPLSAKILVIIRQGFPEEVRLELGHGEWTEAKWMKVERGEAFWTEKYELLSKEQVSYWTKTKMKIKPINSGFCLACSRRGDWKWWPKCRGRIGFFSLRDHSITDTPVTLLTHKPTSLGPSENPTQRPWVW